MIVCSLPGKCGFGFLSAAEGKHFAAAAARAIYSPSGSYKKVGQIKETNN
jgi:hypothetical protein